MDNKNPKYMEVTKVWQHIGLSKTSHAVFGNSVMPAIHAYAKENKIKYPFHYESINGRNNLRWDIYEPLFIAYLKHWRKSYVAKRGQPSWQVKAYQIMIGEL